MSMPMPGSDRQLPTTTTSPRPRSSDTKSSELAAFKAEGAEDPFLANPEGYSGQFGTGVAQPVVYGNPQLQTDAAHPLTEPAQDSSQSVSPAAIHAPVISRNPSDRPSTGSHQDWLSPSRQTENGYSDVSGYTSSDMDDALFLQPGLQFVNDFGDWTNTGYRDPLDLPADTVSNNQNNQHDRTASLSTSNQLLSPVPTSTPSPPAAGPVVHPAVSTLGNAPTNSPQSLLSNRESRQIDSAPQSIAPLSSPRRDTLDVGDRDQKSHPPSPIVKVSSYTRGDSPSREEGLDRAKRGRNDHLSPADDDLSSDPETEDVPVTRGRARTIAVPNSASRTDDGAWLADPSTGQSGLDPIARGDAYVLSPKEMMARQKLEEKNAEVEQWLSNSEANSDIDDPGTRRMRSRVAKRFSGTSRRRARSTGDPSIVGQAGFSASLNFDDSGIPGPGVLIEENSGEEDDDDDDDDDENRSTTSDSTPESPPAQVDISFEDNTPTDDHVSPSNAIEASNEEPLPSQFIRATPWQDPVKNGGVQDSKKQPNTSNAAMMRFNRRADNIENASRAATWGTREMSEADVESIIGPQGQFNSLHIGRNRKKNHSRTNSFFEHATKFFPKRSTSSGKRKYSPQTQQLPGTESPKRKSNDTDSTSTPSVLSRRKNSFPRPAQHSANSAVMAMTEQIAAIGGGANGVRHTPSPSLSSNPLEHLRRRSKSEVPQPQNQGRGGLMSLMTSVGGPPMPTLASPLPDKKASPSIGSERLPTGDDDEDDDMEDDGVLDDKGVVMEFPVGADLIVPSVDGFRTHVRQLNPRLQSELVERIAQEQVRRYKKLVEQKTKHANAVSKGTCTAGKRCFDQGGVAAYLPPRASPKDPESTYGQFQVQGTGNADNGVDEFTEGAVVAAMFPSGVPLPPVKRLPAEFECSLCFKVKKFQKPSDWTKHVHEDLQPFTCSFPDCAEPKSFKRKADWVRHESERHRHLEWWSCNMPDCPHTCYRKDNFVQHLVREHKMPDPKTKPVKSRTTKGAKAEQTEPQPIAGNDPDQDELWRRVDECHHYSPKQPKDEACRFCGNICSSWKKLTVHMAKHMEQVAMPVLELVKQVKVSDDTSGDANKMGSSPHQRHPSGNTSLSTPVSAYPSIKPDPASHSPSSSGISPQVPVYGTAGLPTESLGVPTTTQSPLSSHHLHMQDALAAVPPQSAGHLRAAVPPNYVATSTAAAYPQAGAPTLSPDRIYQNDPTSQYQHHVAVRGNSVTYPPPFNAIPRHQVPPNTSVYAQPPPATTGMTYNLDVNAPVQNVQNTGFEGQQLCASPVDTLRYNAYQPNEYDANGQQIPVNYQAAAMNNNNMGYPDGSMAQANAYMQHGHGPY